MAVDRDQNRMPPTKKDSKYPHNNVHETNGGHRVEYDDTPGKKTSRVSHPSGTYTEVTNDGRVVQVNVANRYEYTKKGYTLTIEENGDLKIGGHCRINVDAGGHVEFGGDVSITIGGKATIFSMGDLKLGTAGNMYLGAAGNIDVNASGNFTMLAGGTSDMQSDGTMTKKAPKIDLNP